MFDVKRIAVIGCSARTEYEDTDLAKEICLDLLHCGYELYHAGLAPFDMLLSSHVRMRYIGDTPEIEYGSRFMMEHPSELYQTTDALLVFPRGEDLLQCSWLVELALEDGKQVIGVTRDAFCIYGEDL